jgi:multicomponent Na+:H+ antiporter subunit E
VNETGSDPRPLTTENSAVPWSRLLLMGVLLAVAWLLWSGLFKPLLLALGAFSCVLVVYLSHRMHLFDTHLFELRYLSRLVSYWAWLGKEVVKSSLDVTRIVLSPGLPISPTVAEFDSTCAESADQAVLGNSITLTPGTLTLNIREGHFMVHALTEAGARDILDGEMDRRVRALRNG